MSDSRKIFCFGSINIDEVFDVPHILRSGETLPAFKCTKLAGGKGANQSVAAAQAGARVVHFGKVGKDAQWIVDLMSEKGVGCSRLIIDPDEPSGRALIQVSRETGDNCIILYAGTNKLICRTDIDHMIADAEMFRHDWIMFQNEVSCGGEMMRIAYERGLIVVFNPAPMTDELLKGFALEHVHILILNEIEGSELCRQIVGSSPDRSNSSIKERMKVVLDLLCRNMPFNVRGIVITLGSEGVVSRFKHGLNNYIDFDLPAAKTTVVDTTGAGDTFVGYFVAELMSLSAADMAEFKHADVDRALKKATVASSLTCEAHGAIQSIPHHSAVDAKIDK